MTPQADDLTPPSSLGFRTGSGFSIGFAEASEGAGPDPIPESGVTSSGPVGFILTEMIAVGGQGEVWEAWQPSLRRTVAVKIHHSGSLKRFAREALLTGELEHPSIVPVLDFGSIPAPSAGGSSVAMVMKRLRGRQWDVVLREEHRAGRLPGLQGLSRQFAIFDAVAQALAYAHSRGVLHLDLKPSQVIVGEFGETYLCDWGMAARVLSDGRLDFVTRPTGPFGTPEFMAPEQALGDLEAVGVHTDTYLLAGLAHFIVSGVAPHALARDVGETIDLARQNRLVPLPDSVPAQLRAVITKGLSARPADRFATVQEMHEALVVALRRAEQEAEAIALTEEAGRRLEGFTDEDYSALSGLEQQLDRAIALSRDDPRPVALRDTVLARHARQALSRGDVALAEVLTERITDSTRAGELAAEIGRVREAAQARELARARTRRFAAFAAVALVVVLLASSVVLSVALRRSADSRAVAEKALGTAQKELTRASLQAAVGFLDKRRPLDAREALKRVPEERRGWEWGFLASRAVPEHALLQPRSHVYTSAVFSEDGSTAGGILSSRLGVVAIAVASRQQKELPGTWSSLAAGPADSVLAGDDFGRVVQLAPTGVVREWALGRAPIRWLGALNDGTVVAIDGENRLWIAEGAEKKSTPLDEPVTCFVSSPFGFAFGTASGRVGHAIRGLEVVYTEVRHSNAVVGIQWDATSPRFATWAGTLANPELRDTRTIIHEAGNAKPVHVSPATDTPLSAAAWSPDGSELMLLTANAWMHELSTRTLEVTRSFYHDVGVGTSAVYTQDGRDLVILSRGLIQLRETEWLGQELVFRADSRRVVASALHGRTLLTAGEDGGLALWNLGEIPARIVASLSPDSIASIDMASDSGDFIAAHRWGWIRWWTTRAGFGRAEELWVDSELQLVRSDAAGQRAVAIGTGGEVLMLARGNGAPTSRHVVAGGVESAAMSPTGNFVLIAPARGGVSILSEAGLTAISGEAATASTHSATAIISPEMWALGGTDGVIRIISNTGELMRELKGHNGRIRTLSSSPDQRYLTSGSDDETACGWDLQTGELVSRYVGSHAGPVVAAIPTPDGRRVLTASEDTLLRVFDLTTGAELLAEEGHRFEIAGMALNPASGQVVTIGPSQVMLWNPLPTDGGSGILDIDPLPYRQLPLSAP